MSRGLSGAFRTFSFWMANGTVGMPILEGVDYRKVLIAEPSLMEQAYAIFANVIEVDETGNPLNAKFAEHRAAQYIRSFCQPGYEVTPAFENWEVALHAPPPRTDPKR